MGGLPVLRVACLLCGLAAALAAASCAGAVAGQPDAVPRAVTTARRVHQILQRRHVERGAASAKLSVRAFEALLRAVDPQTACAAARERLAEQSAGLIEALRNGDLGPVHEAARRCGARSLSEAAAERMALDALAKAFDSHSGYLSPPELAALRLSIHQTLAEAEQARGRVIEQGGERIGVVVLPSFYLQADGRGATRDVRFIVDRLVRERATLLVLDLRGNGGGVVVEALGLLSALGCSGVLAQERRAGAVTAELRSVPEAASYHGPLAVLVDGRTAGVSEVFAAAVQDRDRGLVLGARTRGHGSAQSLVLLRSPKGREEGAVRVTDRFFLRGDGTPIEGRGIVPDVELALEGVADLDLPAQVLEAVRTRATR
jgi:C-terminal processing protease CtpA/Prc